VPIRACRSRRTGAVLGHQADENVLRVEGRLQESEHVPAGGLIVRQHQVADAQPAAGDAGLVAAQRSDLTEHAADAARLIST